MKKLLYVPKYALFRFFLITFGCCVLLFSWWKSLIQSENKALIFLIDSSFSMSVADIVNASNFTKTRIDTAKDIVNALVKMEEKDVAVATFSREMTLQLPLTNDSTLIHNVISGLSADKYGGWSDIYRAMSRIFWIYQHHKNAHIIVLSDMETFEENSDIPTLPPSLSVTFVGIGTKSGGRMIEWYTTNGQPVYRMFWGENAISVLDEKMLARLAEQFSAVSMTVEKEEDILWVTQNIIQNLAQKWNVLPFDFVKLAWFFLLVIGIIFPVYISQKSWYER